jgi:hypothetical protein
MYRALLNQPVKALVGTQMPGEIKVSVDPYEFTVKETGDH